MRRSDSDAARARRGCAGPSLDGAGQLSPPVSPTGAALTSSMAYLLGRLGRRRSPAPSPRRASCRSVATDDRLGVDVEVPAQRVPGVRHAEAVGAERGVVARHPAGDQVRHRAHEVADRDHRARRRRPASAGTYGTRGSAPGLQQVVLLAAHRVAAQLGPGGRRPDVGRHAPVLGEQLLGLERPLHAGAGGQDAAPSARRRRPRGRARTGRGPGAAPRRPARPARPAGGSARCRRSGSRRCSPGPRRTSGAGRVLDDVRQLERRTPGRRRPPPGWSPRSAASGRPRAAGPHR